MLKILFTVLTFSLLFITFFHPITSMTQDLGRHIKTGEIVVHNGYVPTVNLFSYTYPDFKFINTHWLSEVVFYFLFSFGEYLALFLLMLFLVGASFSLVYFYNYRKANIFALSLISFLYLGIISERTDIRPELFSFFFLSLFVTILFKYREKFTILIFLLIPISFIWVNSHIYFFVGLLVVLLFVLDEIITKRNELKKAILKGSLPKHFLILCIVFFVCVLVSLLNPNGLTGLTYPLFVFDNYGYSIEENQNIFFLWEMFYKRTIAFFFFSLITLITIFCFAWKRIRLIDFFLVVFFVVLGLLAIRNFPLFVFGTFISASFLLSYIFEKHFSETLEKKVVIKIAIIVILILLFVWQMTIVVETKGFGFKPAVGASKGVDFFISQKLSGPIFNNFDIGSYLDFRLYPNQKVFVDGRPEAYPSSFFKEVYMPMQENPEIFEKIDEKYNFRTIFFSHSDMTPWAREFLKTISKNDTWRQVYLDDFVVIYVNNLEDTKNINSPTVYFNSSDLNSIYRLYNYYVLLDNKEEQVKMLESILKKDPNSCFALYNRLLLLTPNDPIANIYNGRLSKFCR